MDLMVRLLYSSAQGPIVPKIGTPVIVYSTIKRCFLACLVDLVVDSGMAAMFYSISWLLEVARGQLGWESMVFDCMGVIAQTNEVCTQIFF